MRKNLLILGASSEIGIRILREIYMDYQIVYVQYRKMNDELNKIILEAGERVRVVPLQADLLEEKSVSKMLADLCSMEYTPNHIVHLPAPKAYHKQFHKDQWENFRKGWEISVHAIVEILQILMPKMTKERYGRIVLMLTSCTLNIPPKFQASYVTIKYALLGLMKALSAEYAEKGITVNGISPDMIKTKFLSEVPEMIVEQTAADSPLGRHIYIEELIPVIKYLLSDAGAAMTGQNIGITGGKNYGI